MKNKSAVKVVLDLFSGTGSATKLYRDDPGYWVVSVDIEPQSLNGADAFFKMDIFDFWKFSKKIKFEKSKKSKNKFPKF